MVLCAGILSGHRSWSGITGWLHMHFPGLLNKEMFGISIRQLRKIKGPYRSEET